MGIVAAHIGFQYYLVDEKCMQKGNVGGKECNYYEVLVNRLTKFIV